MAINAFQAGEQFGLQQMARQQALKDAQAQAAGREALAQQFGQGALDPSAFATVTAADRAERGLQSTLEQRGIQNERQARLDEQALAEQQRKATRQERLDTQALAEQQRQVARQQQLDTEAQAQRDSERQVAATRNLVRFYKAGIAGGASPADITAKVAPALSALGVSQDEIAGLPEMIANDPTILDQFEAALRTTAEDQAARRLELEQQRLEQGGQRIAQGDVRLQQGEAGYRGQVKEAEALGKARGEVRAEDLPVSQRMARKQERNVSAQQQRLNLVNSKIDQAIDEADNLTTGILGSALSVIPGTGASDLSATVDTIAANVGFNELQRLRDMSPTGGALGQVSERENALLQSVLGSLRQSQSPDQFKKNLRTLKQQLKLSWQRVADAYEQDFGRTYGGQEGEIQSLLDKYAPQGGQ